jgi:hypothetical protein
MERIKKEMASGSKPRELSNGERIKLLYDELNDGSSSELKVGMLVGMSHAMYHGDQVDWKKVDEICADRARYSELLELLKPVIRLYT